MYVKDGILYINEMKNITTQNNMCVVARRILLLDTRDCMLNGSIINTAEKMVNIRILFLIYK